MIRVPAYFFGSSLQTYQLRFDEPFGARRAAWNHGVLIGRVVDDELGDDAQLAPVCLAHEMVEIGARSVGRVDVAVVGDVVAVVAQRRRVERQEPDRVDAEVLDVVELLAEPVEVAHAVVVRIEEGLDVELVDDGVLVPVRGRRGRRRGLDLRGSGAVVGVVSTAGTVAGIGSGARL